MKYLKVILLAVLLISCHNAHKSRDYQAFSVAKDLYLQGDSQGALEKLESLEKENPSYLLPFNLDGRISLFTGQYERAEEKLTHVLKHSPLDFEAIRWMANLYLLTKQYEKSEKLASIALEKYPEEPRFLLLLAASYKAQGKVKEAVVTYHRAYLFEVELAYAHYEMAQLYSQFGLEKEYKEQIERASALSERRIHE
ncbi:MAG: tetratricopeptide repeat protein [Spirochaetia bacterium]|nr:tetratricopeptide repeat protein [Spirochaetia bacterium]